MKKQTAALAIFAVVYGSVFINYIDVITNGGAHGGYHLWLVFMYFMPFAALTMLNPKNWKLALGLGLLASLMNDVFYGAVSNLMGTGLDLARYYNRWLIPQTTQLFTLNLGFANVAIQSWMMAASIYLRIVVVFVLLGGYRYLPRTNRWVNLRLRSQRMPIEASKPRAYMPEVFGAKNGQLEGQVSQRITGTISEQQPVST